MAKTPADLRSLARSHTGSAIRVLSSIMNEKKAPHAARVAAATAILDRGHGKPTQPVDGSSTIGHYFISDKPKTPEEWERDHCDPQEAEDE